MEWLAIVALIACIFTAFFAYDNWNKNRSIAYGLAGVTVALVIFGKLYMPSLGEHCRKDWDGRGNPTECD